MKKLLVVFLLLIAWATLVNAQVGQAAREWRGGSTPSGSCPTGSPPVIYNGAPYYCNSGTWAAGSGGGGSANLSEAAFASFPTCNSSNKNLRYKRTDGNRDVYTCVYDGSANYKWRSNNGGVFYPEDFGAKGDGSTNDTTAVNAAIAAAIASNTYGAEVVFGPFEYRANIVITEARGIKLRGSGRYNTLLRAATSGSPALDVNGLWYSQFEGIYFAGNGGSPTDLVRVDGNYDGSHTLRVQGNTFKDIYFDGTAGGTTPTYTFSLCRVGGSSGQCSENTFINVHFSGGSTAAYLQNGYNALNNTIIGGNFQSYSKHGIQLLAGSANIYSVGFQSTYQYTQIVNGGYDIDASTGGVTDKIIVDGCRTESLRFYNGGASQYGVIRGFNQNPSISTWATTTAFASNAVIAKTAPSGKIMMYRVTTSGTSGGSEPTWPESGTVADGTITWTQTDVNVINLPSGDYSERYNTAYFSDPTSVKAKRSQYADVREVTTSKTLMQNDSHVLIDATAGNITITLPDIPGFTSHGGQTLYFRRYDSSSNTVTINGATATGTGTSNLNLPPGGWMVLQISGGGSLTRRWWVVASSDHYTYWDVTRESAPGNPASGKLRLFANNTTGKLACLDSAGADCMPSGGGGSGTVTNTGGNLTANSVVLGAGTVDTKVVAGIITDGTSKLTLGIAGTSVGKIGFNNATSGSITLQPTTGALGTITTTLPAISGTLAMEDSTVTVCAAGCHYTTLSAASTAIGGTVKTAKIIGAVTESANFTTPYNITVWPVGDAMITVASGQTWTHQGGVIDPGAQQWIENNSSVSFANNVRTIRPEWWGNNENGMALAIASAQADHHEILVSKGFSTTMPLVLKKNGVSIRGDRETHGGYAGPQILGSHWGPVLIVGNGVAPSYATSLITNTGGGTNEQAIVLNATTDYIALDGGGSVDLRALGAFTAEAFVRPASGALSAQPRYSIMSASGYMGSQGKETFAIYIDKNGGGDDGKVIAKLNVGGTLYTLTGTALTRDGTTVTHIALTYDGTNIKLWQGGTNTATQAATGSLQNYGVEDVVIGATPFSPRGSRLWPALPGAYDSIRISKTARYTGSFTPATTKFSADSNTFLVVNGEGTTAQKADYVIGRTVSNAQVFLPYQQGTGTWVSRAAINDLRIQNTKGGALLTLDTPNMALNNLELSGYYGWQQEGLFFLTRATKLRTSYNDPTAVAPGTAHTRFGVAILGLPAGCTFDDIESIGGRITQFYATGPNALDNAFVTQGNDTEVGLMVYGGTWYSNINNLQYDDEVGTSRAFVPPVAQVFLSNNKRIVLNSGYLSQRAIATPVVALDSVEELTVNDVFIGANAASTSHFGLVAGTTAPKVLEVNHLYRVTTSVPVVDAALTPYTRIKNVTETKIRKTYTGSVGTTAIDLSLGEIIQFTFGAGNETLTLSNIPSQGEFTLVAIQDGTGSRTFTYPSTLKAADGSGTFATQPTAAANARTAFRFLCDGTNCYNVTSSIAASGSGTVNSGASGVLAYYPSTGTTVDDATGLAYAASGSNFTITAQAASDKPLVVKGAASQSGKLLEFQTSAAASLGGVNADNTIYQLGGTTSSFPALKRNGTGISVRLADDSGYGPLVTSFQQLVTTSAVGLVVGDLTNYQFQVDASAGSVATGVKITGAAAGSGVTLAAISSGTNESMTINGKGTGSVTINTFAIDSSGSVTAGSVPVGRLTGLGTGVATALAVNTGSSGAFVVNGGALGTPSSGTLTNATGLPISTGVSGLGTGVATFLATPTSANFASAVTGETGSGGVVFDTSPTIVTPTIAKLANLTTNGFIRTGSGDGTLSVSTSLEYPIYLPVAGCNDTTASPIWNLFTSNKPTATCVTGTNRTKGALSFPDSDGDYTAQVEAFLLPSDWTGNVDVKFRWYSAATTGDVVWQIQTSCVADAETDDPSWNTASTVTDTTKGTTLQMNDATISGITVTGCAAGEMLNLRVLRNRTHASDSISGAVFLVGVQVTARRTH